MMDFRGFFQKITETGTPVAMAFYGVLGVIVAILLLLIGFWKTVLVVLCCLGGCFIGGVKDKSAFLRKVFFRFYERH